MEPNSSSNTTAVSSCGGREGAVGAAPHTQRPAREQSCAHASDTHARGNNRSRTSFPRPTHTAAIGAVGGEEQGHGFWRDGCGATGKCLPPRHHFQPQRTLGAAGAPNGVNRNRGVQSQGYNRTFQENASLFRSDPQQVRCYLISVKLHRSYKHGRVVSGDNAKEVKSNTHRQRPV